MGICNEREDVPRREFRKRVTENEEQYPTYDELFYNIPSEIVTEISNKKKSGNNNKNLIFYKEKNDLKANLPKKDELTKNILKNYDEIIQKNNFNYQDIENQYNFINNNNYNENKNNNQINMVNDNINFSFFDKDINYFNNNNQINIGPLKSSFFPIKIKKCEICFEEFDEYDGLNYELKCGCIIHNICFDDYIKNSIENNNIPILCPNCKSQIHPNFIYDSLINSNNKNLIKKFEKFSMNNYLINHKDSYSCCPTPGCEYMFFFEKGENHFICPECNKEYCLFCKNVWHYGMTCQENIDSKDENKLDEKFKEFVKGKNYKICPKCKFWVEKSEGCNHMKCRCGAHFCYKCGKLIPTQIHDCPCWKK